VRIEVSSLPVFLVAGEQISSEYGISKANQVYTSFLSSVLPSMLNVDIRAWSPLPVSRLIEHGDQVSCQPSIDHANFEELRVLRNVGRDREVVRAVV
jgi:hypothetical protein